MKFLRWNKPVWPSLNELDAALAPGVPKQQCAKFLDSFQHIAFKKLTDEYDDQTFAKLVALKLTNLAALRYHLLNRHSVLFSHPVQLMVDPANACQLGCPGCVHSTNKEWAALFDWPNMTLSLDTYDAFLDTFGPFAFCAALYNYGEPLLNKRFDAMVRSSKEFLLFTITSTNLSMPLNAESIVASGLDHMILSIDGTTQAVYERYRRKGDLALVFENVRNLVAAKKNAGSPTPYLAWHFLTFEHNHHQVEEALRIAEEIGVNQINITTPFEVDLDDPSIRAVKSPRAGGTILRGWDARWFTPEISARLKNRSRAIDAAFSESWQTRLRHNSATDPSAPQAHTCSWLYRNITLDGAGRIMPCCMAPDKAEKNVVFSNFTAAASSGASEIVNSPMAVMARESFADRAAYEAKAAKAAVAERGGTPYCAKCSENPGTPYPMSNYGKDVRMLDSKRVIPDETIAWLTLSEFDGYLESVTVVPAADASREILIFGWALDHNEKIETFLVTINKGLPTEVRQIAQYGLPRADVRSVLPHLPQASNCGFQALFHAPAFGLDGITSIEGTAVTTSGEIRTRVFAMPAPKSVEQRLADVELPSNHGRAFGFLDNLAPCYAGEGRQGLVVRGWIVHAEKPIVQLTLLAHQAGQTVASTDVEYGLEHADLSELLQNIPPKNARVAFRAVFDRGDFKIDEMASFLADITLEGGRKAEAKFPPAIIPQTMTTLIEGVRLPMRRPGYSDAFPDFCFGNLAAVQKVSLGKQRVGYYVCGWLLAPEMRISDVWLQAEERNCDIFHFGYPHHSLENAYPTEKGSKGWFSGLLLDDDWHAAELACRITGRRENAEEFFLEFPIHPVNCDWYHARPKQSSAVSKNIGVFQCFYNDQSKERLDPGLIPYFNDRISRFFENDVIVELINSQKHSGWDYFGVFSWRFSEKIPLRSEMIFDLMNEDGYEADVYTFFEGIHSGLGEVGYNTWTFGECSHPGLIEAGEALLNRLGLRVDLRRLAAPIIYQNHFICRSGLYERYVRELLDPALRVMSDTGDREIQELVGRDAQYIARSDTATQVFGRPYFSMEPFVCERLFSVWAALQSLKVRHISRAAQEP